MAAVMAVMVAAEYTMAREAVVLQTLGKAELPLAIA